MTILIRAAQLFLSLLILIIVHEFGHFISAKIFHVRVEKFYIFFNPWFSIWKRKVGNTEYGIGWLPLGGYTKIGGMVDESLDTDQLAAPPRPDDFRSKPAWQRLIIMCAGVLMNLILAWTIYSCLLFSNGHSYLALNNATYGIAPTELGKSIGFQPGDKILAVNGQAPEEFAEVYSLMALHTNAIVTIKRHDSTLFIRIPKNHLDKMLAGDMLFSLRTPMCVYDVAEGSPAQRAGLQKGDSLVAIEGQPAAFFDEFKNAIANDTTGSIELTVARGNQNLVLHCQVPESGIVGIYADSNPSRFFKISKKNYSLLAAIPAGLIYGKNRLCDYWQSLKMLFVPEAKAHKSLGGFIAMAKMFPAHWDWTTFWSFTAFISIILAVMNILPIPGLDGGHVLFLLYEVITRKKPSTRFLSNAISWGLLFLLLLVLYANINDIIRLFQ